MAADTHAKQSYADTLLDFLSRSGLPNVVTTTWIAQQMGKPWRAVSKHVMPLAEVQRAIENLGWVYCIDLASASPVKASRDRPSSDNHQFLRWSAQATSPTVQR
jgi:hypothetical protein